MEKNHQILGGDVQLFKRPNSRYWYAQATVGKRRRLSTKKDNLKLAEDVARDWYLGLQGKAAAGLLKSEPTFAAAAKKFMAEYQTVTNGRRSQKWTDGHEARVRLHLLPFFGKMGLSEITPGAVQDYRVHRMRVGTYVRGGNRVQKAAPDPTPASLDDDELEDSAPLMESGGPRKPPSTSTLHDEVVTLNLVLKTAVRHGWLSNAPDVSAPYNLETKVSHRRKRCSVALRLQVGADDFQHQGMSSSISA